MSSSAQPAPAAAPRATTTIVRKAAAPRPYTAYLPALPQSSNTNNTNAAAAVAKQRSPVGLYSPEAGAAAADCDDEDEDEHALLISAYLASPSASHPDIATAATHGSLAADGAAGAPPALAGVHKDGFLLPPLYQSPLVTVATDLAHRDGARGLLATAPIPAGALLLAEPTRWRFKSPEECAAADSRQETEFVQELVFDAPPRAARALLRDLAPLYPRTWAELGDYRGFIEAAYGDMLRTVAAHAGFDRLCQIGLAAAAGNSDANITNNSPTRIPRPAAAQKDEEEEDGAVANAVAKAAAAAAAAAAPVESSSEPEPAWLGPAVQSLLRLVAVVHFNSFPTGIALHSAMANHSCVANAVKLTLQPTQKQWQRFREARARHAREVALAALSKGVRLSTFVASNVTSSSTKTESNANASTATAPTCAYNHASAYTEADVVTETESLLGGFSATAEDDVPWAAAFIPSIHEFRATRDIAAGEEICISYMPVHAGLIRAEAGAEWAKVTLATAQNSANADSDANKNTHAAKTRGKANPLFKSLPSLAAATSSSAGSGSGATASATTGVDSRLLVPLTFEQRQRYLHRQFQFHCSCPLCLAELASAAALVPVADAVTRDCLPATATAPERALNSNDGNTDASVDRTESESASAGAGAFGVSECVAAARIARVYYDMFGDLAEVTAEEKAEDEQQQQQQQQQEQEQQGDTQQQQPEQEQGNNTTETASVSSSAGAKNVGHAGAVTLGTATDAVTATLPRPALGPLSLSSSSSNNNDVATSTSRSSSSSSSSSSSGKVNVVPVPAAAAALISALPLLARARATAKSLNLLHPSPAAAAAAAATASASAGGDVGEVPVNAKALLRAALLYSRHGAICVPALAWGYGLLLAVQGAAAMALLRLMPTLVMDSSDGSGSGGASVSATSSLSPGAGAGAGASAETDHVVTASGGESAWMWLLSAALLKNTPLLAAAAADSFPLFPPTSDDDNDDDNSDDDDDGDNNGGQKKKPQLSDCKLRQRQYRKDKAACLLSPSAVLMCLTALTLEPLCFSLDRTALYATIQPNGDLPLFSNGDINANASTASATSLPPASPAVADTLRSVAFSVGAPLSLAASCPQAFAAVTGAAVARVLVQAPQSAALVGGGRPDAGSFERLALRTAMDIYALYNTKGMI